MDEEFIISQMRTVISAGYETVSAVLAVFITHTGSYFPTDEPFIQWMLYEVAVHPELQSKLQQEVSSSPDHSFEDLMNCLPLLDATLKETLRLHPPILENHHEVNKPSLRIYSS